MGIKGRIHSIETFGTLDGPGVRYVLFLQGCALRCLYCHNPDTWDTETGTETDSDEVVRNILPYKNFIKTGGVTISGGEPLLQPEFVADIIRQCKEHGIHTAIDTAGSVMLSLSKKVLDEVDMLLLDIKSLDEEQCIELTSKSNRPTLATLGYCESIKKRVWIRHVLVPGYTLDNERLKEMAAYLKHFTCIERIELLPFHKMGEFKWKALRIPYKLENTREPEKSELAEAKKIFEDAGLKVLMKE